MGRREKKKCSDTETEKRRRAEPIVGDKERKTKIKTEKQGGREAMRRGLRSVSLSALVKNTAGFQ